MLCSRSASSGRWTDQTKPAGCCRLPASPPPRYPYCTRHLLQPFPFEGCPPTKAGPCHSPGLQRLTNAVCASLGGMTAAERNSLIRVGGLSNHVGQCHEAAQSPACQTPTAKHAAGMSPSAPSPAKTSAWLPTTHIHHTPQRRWC